MCRTVLAAQPLGPPGPAIADNANPIKLAQSIALTGPLGELGQAMEQGVKVCFAVVNAKGSVNGRPLELTTLDDGYDVKRALANVTGFLEDASNFTLFNCMGTPMIEAMLPKVIDSGIPFFTPFSGALSIRPKNTRNVFNIRASYADEAEQLVQHLATVGIKRIAIVYQNISFGKEVFTATQQAMARYRWKPLPSNTSRPVVRDLPLAWKVANVPLEPSHLALEGYINARVFVEAVRRAGRNPNRSNFIDSTWAIKNLDLGGFAVNFSEAALNASRFVELTMVSGTGRFIR